MWQGTGVKRTLFLHLRLNLRIVGYFYQFTEDYVKKRGVKQVFIEKGSPWQNGKVERQFRTLKEEWIAYRKYRTITSLNDSLKEYRRWFNGEREIQKLGYRTPNEIERDQIPNITIR